MTLVKEAPNLTVAITLSDLFEFGEELVRSSKQNLVQIISDENAEKYFSPKVAAEQLDVDLSTLWRWAKQGYLVPLELGGKRRYRKSDIDKILKKGCAV